MKILHKIARYTKEQKAFVLYLIVLTVFMLFFPIVKIAPVESLKPDFVFVFGGCPRMMIVVFLALFVLLAWNMSFKFKNLVINLFGFKENDSLFNFLLLIIITTAYLVGGDFVTMTHRATSTFSLTFWYYLVWILLMIGLVLTLLVIVKKVKKGDRSKIVNIVDEEAMRDVKSKKHIEGLFDKK